MDTDGLNTLDYKILKSELKPLYTHIVVDVKPRWALCEMPICLYSSVCKREINCK